MEHRVIKIALSLFTVFCISLGATKTMTSVRDEGLSRQEDAEAASGNGPGVAHDEASGTTIFWAMTALACFAMTQPSYSGHWISGDTFSGLLWPHRSSYVTCMVDMVLEIDEIDMNARQREGQPGGGEGRRRTATGEEVVKLEKNAGAAFMLRLGIFVLGVVPQAVQVFSMKGVSDAQMIAAAFLVPSFWSLVRSAPYFQRRWVLRKRPVWSLEIVGKGEEHWGELAESCEALKMSWLCHGLAVFGAWGAIAKRITIPCSDDARAVITRVQLCGTLFCMVVTIVEIIRRPHREERTLRRTKASLIVLPIWVLQDGLSIFRGEKERVGSPAFLQLIPFSGFCFGAACALKGCADWMGGSALRTTSGEEVQTADQAPSQNGSRMADPRPEVSSDIGMQSIRVEYELSDMTTECTTAHPNSTPETAVTRREEDVVGRGNIFHRMASELGQVPWRLYMGAMEVWLYEPVTWCLVHLVRRPVEVWVAFAMLNLGSAALYYCWAFDGQGTSAPRWSQALG